MSIRRITLWLVLVAVSISLSGLFGLGGNVVASVPLLSWGIDYNLTVESLPTKGGVVTLRLTIERWKDVREGCDSVILMVTNERGAAYSGPERWVVPLTEGAPYVCFVDLNIPENDTCAVEFSAGCRFMIDDHRWFVTTGDTLEMYAQHPANARKYQPTWSDVMRAKFTPEQLQKVFDFRLDLRNTLAFQRDSIGTLIRTYNPTDTPEVYLIRTSIDNWITLTGDFRATMEPIDEGAFLREFPPADWETPQQQQDSSDADDTSKPQGSLYNDPNLQNQGAITLERVTGLTGDNTLPINQTITYYIRMNNNTGTTIRGITNGFRIYSPHGAT